TISKRDWSSDVCSSDLSSLFLLAGSLFGRVDTPHDDRIGTVVVTASHTDLFETEVGVELLGTWVVVTYLQEHVRAAAPFRLVEQLGEQGAAHPPAPEIGRAHV